jgi:hypothetical protein
MFCVSGYKVSSILIATDDSEELRLTFNGLHGVIFQKIELFISIAVRTSNPTKL